MRFNQPAFEDNPSRVEDVLREQLPAMPEFTDRLVSLWCDPKLDPTLRDDTLQSTLRGVLASISCLHDLGTPDDRLMLADLSSKSEADPLIRSALASALRAGTTPQSIPNL